MNKRGFILILSFMVILVLVILSTAIITKSVSESRIAYRYNTSTQAFWLAEAGINYAVTQLNSNPDWSGTTNPVPLGNGTYSVTVELVPDYSLRRQIISTGLVDNSQRRIKVIVTLSWNSDPGVFTCAIETTGGFNITGSVDINPDGSYITQSPLDFVEVFGASPDTIKSGADHLYVNPSANQQPVNGVTWVDLTGDSPATATRYTISSNWSGDGLLIVDGHRNTSTEDIPALEISGVWNFNGIIWVFGKIKITGTPVITGGVFAETSVDVDSTLAGNATLNFSSSIIQNTFTLLSSGSLTVDMYSWQEL